MPQLKPRRRWIALVTWLLGAAFCGVLITNSTFDSDLSAFLPKSPTKEQRVLIDQLRSGILSRLILIGIEGGDASTRATLSKETAKLLRADSAFATINNGEPVNVERDRAFLFNNRYLLSSSVTLERFSINGLHDAIGNTVAMLASSVGMLIKPLVPRDPTGELFHLLEQMKGHNPPHVLFGVWASKDEARSLLLAQTSASGADIDAQKHAVQTIKGAFKNAQQQSPSGTETKLIMSGPGVFAVSSRDTIRDEVTRLCFISSIIIITLLFLVYRSATAVVLNLLPVVSGILVGIVAVSLTFGLVHGITLGFGTTLIGEAVDYSIYLFVQSRHSESADGKTQDAWIANFWPTIRLGVMTSIVGFSTLLLSSFPGLAQLGVFTIAGLITAAVVTRFILPQLLPSTFIIRDLTVIAGRMASLSHRIKALRWPLALLMLLSLAVLINHRETLWNPELAAVSPISPQDLENNARLRSDIGAPDARFIIAISGPNKDAVLQSSEVVAERLQPLVTQGVLFGFESPSNYLPSTTMQKARQNALPSIDLPQRIKQAVEGLPVHADLFTPFISDVGEAKTRQPLQASDLTNTSLGIALDSLLFERDNRWNAILPLSLPQNAAPEDIIKLVRDALNAASVANAHLIDLKSEADNLYIGYLHEAVLLSFFGLCGIIILLLLALRSPLQVIRVMLPLVGAILAVSATLALVGQRMTILHLVGLLLIVAVGSNYALFFNPKTNRLNREASSNIASQTLVSLVFANLTTVAGFGLLGFSHVPVLKAIGETVGPGAMLALVFSAILAGGKPAASTAAR